MYSFGLNLTLQTASDTRNKYELSATSKVSELLKVSELPKANERHRTNDKDVRRGA